MPNSVTHVLIAIILVDLVRDYIIKDKRFKLHYVLIAGIAGLLPDIDYFVDYFNHLTGYTTIHPAYTHNLLIPVVILGIAFLVKKRKLSFLDKKNKFAFILLLIASGYFIHLALDFIAWDSISLLPLGKGYGLNLIPPNDFGRSLLAGIDAILLIAWLWHEEVRHKIRDFI
ncbi:metal-dependent hydrolase [Candidatus Pacearchaeota archaeon]|nr:metal-dependent hydrolase [Candidatus Pacearchaeota archaeon]